MNVLDHFSIPYQGLKNGPHEFFFDVDDEFFQEFENSIVSNGKFDVILDLDKRSDMAVATFNIKGSFTTSCDRCLADLLLDMDEDFVLHIKYGENRMPEEDVIFIESEATAVNFAQYIYESIVLSMPMIKVHEDVSDCDQDVIDRMNNEETIEEEKPNIWASLKGLDLN